MTKLIQNKEYNAFIHQLKSQIQSAQIKAAVTVNRELLRLYWLIASQIVEKQKQAQRGTGLIKQVSKASSIEDALFYVQKSIENNGPRAVLTRISHQTSEGLSLW